MKKILIVEDSPLNSAILRNSLKAENYDIEVAFTGETAIDLFLKFNPQMILLDYELPDVNGLYVLQELQEKLGDQWKTNHKVIVLTGHNEQDIVKQFIDHHIDGYFVKPFDIPSIKEKIRKLLN